MTVATDQGTRPHQEDRWVQAWIDLPLSPGWLLAIFDGHRGAATADKASAALPDLFRSQLQLNQGNAPEGFRETFSALHRLTRTDVSGSTASAVFVPAVAQQATWAILGDSPIVMMNPSGALHISLGHNVRTNLQERAEAERRGGVYRAGYLEDRERPGIGLQMARSLGDADLARVLKREPDIGTISLGRPGIVLVGSDGLLGPGDVCAEDQMTRLAAMIRDGADAQALVGDALRRRSGDNVTAIVWRLD